MAAPFEGLNAFGVSSFYVLRTFQWLRRLAYAELKVGFTESFAVQDSPPLSLLSRGAPRL